MTKNIFNRINITVLILKSSIFIANAQTPLYLDSSLSTEERVEDLMSHMTLEEKVYQMNQFVGLEHMKKGNPDDDKENNDAQGFYKTLTVNDVSKMCEEGKIGSFLCNASYCASYRVSSRMATDPSTSLEHLGFRTVMDLKTE